MTIRIDGSNTTANPGITGADADTGLQFGTDEVKIVTGGSDRVTVDSSGRVGVGTTSPSNLLHLSATGANCVQKIERASGASFFLEAQSTNFECGTTTNSPIVVYANNAEKARLDSSGYLRFASGTGGLQFNGDTAAANALDDYEEGTFNPNISATGTGSFTSQNLFYTKVGRIVSINGRVQCTRTGTASGVLKFTLPFVADDSISGATAPWMSHGSCFTHGIGIPGDGVGVIFWEINSNTEASLFYVRNGSSWTAIDPNLIPTGNSGYLTFSIVYRAAA